jgi:DNA-binding CsgD family transcriptional regulator
MNEKSMIELVGATPTAAVLVGPDGDILMSNALAGRILSKRDNLRIHRGQLWSDGSSKQLKQLLDDAFLGEGSAVVVLQRKRSERPLMLRAMLLKEDPPSVSPAIVVLIVDLDERPSPDPALVQYLFQLTAMEASLACSLVAGQSVTGAARKMGITVNTVRGHLKKIFIKTRLARQAELIDLILRSPVYGSQAKESVDPKADADEGKATEES